MIIYISGYWKDNKETFENYKCLIAEPGCSFCDEDIFYYFEDEIEVRKSMEPSSKFFDFVIIKYTKEEV